LKFVQNAVIAAIILMALLSSWHSWNLTYLQIPLFYFPLQT